MSATEPAAAKVLEVGGRLRSGPGSALVARAFAEELRHQAGLAQAIGLVDLAYVVANTEAGHIPAEQGRPLLRALQELQQHNINYYVLAMPTISDYEFDQKLKELEALEAE